jgi:3-hexulose-6-phosphate synthase
MDVGEYEAISFYEVGADICIVLGVSDKAIMGGVIKAANANNLEV